MNQARGEGADAVDEETDGQRGRPGPDVMAYAARRERTVDEHNFTAEWPGFRGTFRLQLFTAPGQRPVALATQCVGMDFSEGPSLIRNRRGARRRRRATTAPGPCRRSGVAS